MWESAWQASGVVSRLSDCQRHDESHGGPVTKEMKREVVLVDYYIYNLLPSQHYQPIYISGLG